MNTESTPRSTDPHSGGALERAERLIGRHEGDHPGPVMVVLGGLHGNEPSGVAAARQVLDHLQRRVPRFRGRLVALIGNTRAIVRGARYIENDLNRLWTPERVAALVATDHPEAFGPEGLEQRELMQALEGAIEGGQGEVYFVDMHTTSAGGAPFLTVGDTLRNRRFTRGFPFTKILGIEEQLQGSLLEYLSERGCITTAVEGGRHDDPAAVRHHVAALWVALVCAGMIDPRDVPDYSGSRRLLREAQGSAPDFLEIRYRHAIRPEDDFRMEPGFSNFQPVAAGELLARDRGGEIRARDAGIVLMPLYQGLGEDGFFLGRPVSRRRLKVSRWMRHLRLAALLPLLPGVSRKPGEPQTLVLRGAAARKLPLDLALMLGYRRRRKTAEGVELTRRLLDR